MASARQVGEISRAALPNGKGLVAVIKVFMDESGTHEGSKVVTVSAYCGRPRVWETFTKRWNAAKKPIHIYHAKDAQNLRGEFKGWAPQDRDAVAIRLLQVLRERSLIGFAIGINLADLEEELAGRHHLKALLGSPYGMCFQYCVEEVMSHMEEENNNQAIAFIHEDNDFKQEALASFSYVKARRQRHRSSMTLTFASKEDFVPLQAADVLAYEANKRGRDVYAPARRPLEALGGQAYIQGFCKPNMKWLVDRLEVLNAEISTFGHPNTFLPFQAFEERKKTSEVVSFRPPLPSLWPKR